MRHERIFNLLFAPFCNPAHSLIGGLRLAESQCSAVIARSTHSSLHLGVGLRILLATRDISPFCCLSTATRPPNWDFITSNHLPALFWFSKKKSPSLSPDFASRFACELFLCADRQGDSSRRALRFNKEACGSLFVFGGIGWISLLERKAWERNCPRHPERLKPRLKSPGRRPLHPPRPTDR